MQGRLDAGQVEMGGGEMAAERQEKAGGGRRDGYGAREHQEEAFRARREERKLSPWTVSRERGVCVLFGPHPIKRSRANGLLQLQQQS